jgi:hypothetical protein
MTWVAIAAGFRHTLLRRSDGVLAAFGENNFGQCNVPALPAGLAWVGIAAGSSHSVARLSDGSAVGFGSAAEANVPPTPPGLVYVAIAESCARLSDGTAIGFGPNASGQNDIPPLPPGQSYVEVDSGFNANVLRLGPACSYRRLAPGCAGTRPPARIVPSDTPSLGVPLRLRLFDLPADIALLISGFRTTTSSFGPLPWSLAPLGAPGCSLFVSDDAVTLVTGSGSQAEVTIAIPSRPALLGLPFHQQALVPDAAANPFGAVMSDAMTAIVGRP